MTATHTVSLKTKIALIISIILWASAFPGIRAALVGFSPGGLALIRFLIASVCMYFISGRTPWKKPAPLGKAQVSLRDAILLLILGAITIGTYHIALNYGELSVPSGVASFIVGLSPAITVVLAAIFLKETITTPVIIGLIVCILGVGLMTLHLHGGEKLSLHMGLLCVLLSALMSAFYTVFQKPFLKKYHAIDVTAYILWGATLLLLFFIPDLYKDLQNAPWSAMISAIYLGIFPAAIAYITWTYALGEISATRASISMYFLPIVATLLGWAWLNEIPTFYSLTGGAAVLIGIWIVNNAYSRDSYKKAVNKA